MHQTSKDKMKIVATLLANRTQPDAGPICIIDIGAVEPSYRNIFENTVPCDYQTMNVSFSDKWKPNASLHVKEPYNWSELESSAYDAVICGQVFEHVEFFWITLLEIQRILKPGGVCAIAAPSHWEEHRAPYDCYRFYADGLHAMAKFVGFDVLYAFAEHEPLVGRHQCDAILVAEKPVSPKSDDLLYRNAHQTLLKLLPTNYSVEVSRNMPTMQSSSSAKWAAPGDSPQGASAVSGIFTGEYSFHTRFEVSPWWIVDLLKITQIDYIKIFNRMNIEKRAEDIDVLLSDDFLTWRKIFSNNSYFGGCYDGRFLTVQTQERARYVRIQKRGEGYLHLDQVQVFGFV